jgi:hypothetical protein
MIPPGYITLPEALDIIQACIDDADLYMLQGSPDPKCRRYAAIQGLGDEVSDVGSLLSLYVMKGGKPSILRRTDARKLVEEGWLCWIEKGCVDANAAAAGDQVFGTKDRPATVQYDGCQLLVTEYDVRRYWKPQVRPELPKSGAPGRPSSMDLVLREFGGRMARNETAPSRDAESKELARWLADKHPDMPKCSAKTILNKLPPAFQPRNGRE